MHAVAALSRHFGLPLDGWYPPEVTPSVPHPISWLELCRTIPEVYDIEAESRRLKADVSRFEALRDLCDVVYLDRTDGISTTDVKSRLKG